MRDNPRTTVLTSVVGVVLLGALFAFTVLVPELGDDPASSPSDPAGPAESSSTQAPGEATNASSGPIDLPDELDGGLVAADLGTLSDAVVTGMQLPAPADLKKQEAAVVAGLEDVFGVPGAYRIYFTQDGSVEARVTALDKAPGLFAPSSLPVDPAELGVARATTEIVNVDGAVCEVTWGAEVPLGQPIDPSVDPQAYRCQLGDGDRTYELITRGSAVSVGVDILKNLASA